MEPIGLAGFAIILVLTSIFLILTARTALNALLSVIPAQEPTIFALCAHSQVNLRLTSTTRLILVEIACVYAQLDTMLKATMELDLISALPAIPIARHVQAIQLPVPNASLVCICSVEFALILVQTGR